MGLLRVALAMVVALAHAGGALRVMDPGLAVQAFFIISGFYMALILEGKYRGSAWLFYSNRLLRLFPSYFVVLAAAAIALLAFNINRYIDRAEFLELVQDPATGFALIASNLTLIGQDVLCWFDITPDHRFALDPTYETRGPNAPAWTALLVPQAWSLSLELAFYLLAPLFARTPWWGIALAALVSIGVRFAGMGAENHYYLWPQRIFPAELFLFLFGMLAYRASGFAAKLPKAIGWACVAFLLALVAMHDRLGLAPEQGRWLIYGAFTLGLPFAFNAFRASRLDAWIGELSYPIYICHVLVIAVVGHFSPPHALAVTLAGVVALALALRFAIEHPIDGWRQRRVGASGAPQRA